MQTNVPGLQAVRKVLAPIPLGERPALLAYLEQEAKRESDLQTLRALREYRRLHQTSTPQLPKD